MQTLDLIKDLAVQRCGASVDRLDTARTLKDAGLDSLAAIDLVFAVEREFGITIDATELERASSLEDIAGIVDRLRGTA